ncbi:MAG: ABC transporter permease [Pseudomonadota bacterium]|nr:ABC transporter permease [Pseudomonadota bacterium]
MLPMLLWVLVSYVPGLWQPYVQVTDPGDVAFFRVDMLIEKEQFAEQKRQALEKNVNPPTGERANPVYLPAPHEVATALYTSFVTPPVRRSEVWFHQSIGHSISIIFWGFLYSCLLGVPLGVLCGADKPVSQLAEPFIEFARYFPAPAFGALAVAILGIHDAPKIAIIFIGTFFQMVLVISNTTRRLDVRYLEAAQTLGANRLRQLMQVVVPGILPDLYKDLRILLGWAWTYLIVAELIGTSSGITWFITQQARYKNFDMVFAALIILGIIGLLSDFVLERSGRRLFPWQEQQSNV